MADERLLYGGWHTTAAFSDLNGYIYADAYTHADTQHYAHSNAHHASDGHAVRISVDRGQFVGKQRLNIRLIEKINCLFGKVNNSCFHYFCHSEQS